jgi:integrase
VQVNYGAAITNIQQGDLKLGIVPELRAEVVSQFIQAESYPQVKNCNFKQHEILLNQVNDPELSNRGKRVLKIIDSGVTGLKLELSSKKRQLVIKTKTIRCVLLFWDSSSLIENEQVMKALNDFKVAKNKLGKMPSTEEYKMFSKKLVTVGEVISYHLEFNVKNKHGEGSSEWDLIKSLVSNHLSQPQSVKLPSGKVTEVTLLNEKLSSYTQAEYKAFLNQFKDTNGLHDKIVSRVKAAVRFCYKKGVFSKQDFLYFHEVPRISSSRHVVVSCNDFDKIINYLSTIENEDFLLFMLIQSSGHFRTKQTMSLEYSHIDFKNNQILVTAKGGKHTKITVAKELCDLLRFRMNKREDRTSWQSKFVFPSSSSKSGYRTPFVNEWNELRIKLGFFHLDLNEKVVYQYTLHDFRETLLERAHGYDDPTLAAMLGHLSLNAIKHYRRANPQVVKCATEQAFNSVSGYSGLINKMSCL